MQNVSVCQVTWSSLVPVLVVSDLILNATWLHLITVEDQEDFLGEIGVLWRLTEEEAHWDGIQIMEFGIECSSKEMDNADLGLAGHPPQLLSVPSSPKPLKHTLLTSLPPSQLHSTSSFNLLNPHTSTAEMPSPTTLNYLPTDPSPALPSNTTQWPKRVP